MFRGARVTDAVDFFWARGEVKSAVKIVRLRVPERYRWRTAVEACTLAAGRLRGRDRWSVVEPIRELALDLDDRPLQREVVLDARKHGIDLDRGEVLPARTGFDVRRLAYLAGADMEQVRRYVTLPEDVLAPVDTAAVTLVGRAIAQAYLRRARRMWLELPDPDGPEPVTDRHRRLDELARKDSELAQRWGAFSRAMTSEAA